MPRCRETTGLIADARDRKQSLARRKKGLLKSAWELSKLCGVQIAVAFGGDDGATVWESEGGGAVARYRALPAADRARHTHRAYAEAELAKQEKKLATARRAGPHALPPWHGALDGMTPEELKALLASFDAAVLAVEERQRAVGLPAAAAGGQQPNTTVEQPLVADSFDEEDMDAWIAELMWDGEMAQQQQPGPSGVQHGITGGDNVGVVGGQSQQQHQMQMIPGHGWITDGAQSLQCQYQPRDSMAAAAGGFFPFSQAVDNFQQSATSSMASWGGNYTVPPSSHAVAAPVEYPYYYYPPDGGNFLTGAAPPAAAMGTGRRSNDAMGYGFQRQCLPGGVDHQQQYYCSGSGMAAAGYQQVQASPGMSAAANNAHHDAVWPDLATYGTPHNPSYDAVAPVGYAPMDLAGSSSSYAPAPAPAAAGNSMGAQPCNYDEHETPCLLSADDQLLGLDGAELLNYFSDVADGLVVF